MKEKVWLRIKLWSCVVFSLAVLVFLCLKPFKISGDINGTFSIFSPKIFKYFRVAQAFSILVFALYIFATIIMLVWAYKVTFHKEGKKIRRIFNIDFQDQDVRQFGFALLVIFASFIMLIKAEYHKHYADYAKLTILSPMFYVLVGMAVALLIILLLGPRQKKEKSVNDVENYLNSKDE